MQQSYWREGGLIDQSMKNPAVLGMVKELFIQMGYIAMG
jgi:hypothetical protein